MDEGLDLLQNQTANPMTTTITPPQELSPEGRAVLALVLSRGKGYAEIAALLRMDPDDVRGRAHVAADVLAPEPARALSFLERGRIVDYLLGEQTVSQRARTRDELNESAQQREWAAALALALGPIAAQPLPVIPEGDDAAGGETDRDAPGSAPLELERHPPPTRRRVPWVAFASLAVATAAVAAAVIAITDNSGSSTAPQPPRKAAAGPGAAPPGATASAAVKTIHHLVLSPAGADRNAFAAATVAQQGTQTLLLLQGRGLAPNHGDSYAVWLYNSVSDARLLGFISPAVGTDGRFSSGTPLPDDAVRFHALMITREQGSQPNAPGQPVLRGPLSLR